MRPEEQIVDHIDVSTHSIDMPFESTPSFHLNRIEELEHEKHVEKVVKVHEVYKLDNDPQCLDEVIRYYLATHTPHVEPVESYCKNECDNDELLFQEKFEDEFSKFCVKTSVEEQKIASTHMEKMEHTDQTCEDAYMDNELFFLDELFTEECDHSGEKICVEDLEFRVPFEKKKLDLSIFPVDEPTNDQSFENLFEDKPICLDESVRDALVSYTPPKKIVDLSIEVMFEDELRFIRKHIVATLIMLCD